ncbi:beta/gamma crystallin-related protein [Tardiphaga sp. 1201_B9_N1_1]|uniref:beta/gamma crystallin-related protein n=1 Tax=unclassified Tardiphaga TaxID=2631404 RepID=UPI003F1F7E4E
MKALACAAALVGILASASPSSAACQLYWNENFSGETKWLERSESDLTKVQNKHLGNWNDETSSMIVTRGDICRVFEHIDYGGAYRDLREGSYPNPAAMGMPDNSISSVELRRR